MHRLLARLVPPFLRRLDQSLLLHHPAIWATRIHYVLFYGVLGLGLLTLHALSRPLALPDLPQPGANLAWLTLAALAALAFWGWQSRAFRDQVPRGLGCWYLLGVSLLALGPLLYTSLLTWRIDRAFSLETLRAEIDALNQGGAYFYGHNPRPHPDQGRYFYTQPQIGLYSLYGDPLSLENRDAQYEARFLAADAAQHLAYIETFGQVYARYTGKEIPFDAPTIWYAFQHRQPLPGSYEPNWHRVEQPLYIISRIKQHDTPIQTLFFWLMAATVAGWLALGLALFRLVPSRWFFLTLALGLGTAITWGTLAEMLQLIVTLRTHQMDLLWGGYLIGYGLLLLSALRRRDDASRTWRPLVSLSLLTLALPGLLPLLWFGGVEVQVALGLSLLPQYPSEWSFATGMLLSLALSWIGWGSFLAPRLQSILAGPRLK